MKKSTINFEIQLDENHVPEQIEWSATDAQVEGVEKAKAMMISLWDEKESNTMRIDLWTKDMQVQEMKHFFFQSLMTMMDTYERATGDNEFAAGVREDVKSRMEKAMKE